MMSIDTKLFNTVPYMFYGDGVTPIKTHEHLMRARELLADAGYAGDILEFLAHRRTCERHTGTLPTVQFRVINSGMREGQTKDVPIEIFIVCAPAIDRTFFLRHRDCQVASLPSHRAGLICARGQPLNPQTCIKLVFPLPPEQRYETSN